MKNTCLSNDLDVCHEYINKKINICGKIYFKFKINQKNKNLSEIMEGNIVIPQYGPKNGIEKNV